MLEPNIEPILCSEASNFSRLAGFDAASQRDGSDFDATIKWTTASFIVRRRQAA
jgi:hypothetical protein